MTRDERLAELKRAAEAEDDEPEITPNGDPVLEAAARIVDHVGWYYDPVMDPETVLDFVALVMGEPVEPYWGRGRA